MSQILNRLELYCGIESCKVQFRYILDDDDPVALDAHWFSKTPDAVVLVQVPVVGEAYEIQLGSSVSLDVSQPFWVIWMDALACLNGMETGAEAARLRFCRCKAIEIREQERTSAILRVRVEEICAPGECRGIPETTDWVKTEFDGLWNTRPGWSDCSDGYAYVNVSIEGDTGACLIARKEDGRYRVVASNYWFLSHEDTWRLRNELLSPELQEKYGLRTDG